MGSTRKPGTRPAPRRRGIRSGQGPSASIAVLIALVIAGCGSTSHRATGSTSNGSSDTRVGQNASQLLAASREAAGNASSVTITVTDAQSKGAELSLSLALNTSGSRGSINLLGARSELIRIGNDVYLKGGQQQLARAGFANVPAGAWVKTTPAREPASLLSLAGETKRLLATGGTPTLGATTQIGGQPVEELKTTGKLYTGRLYVRASGKPYPVLLEKQGQETGRVTFTDWNSTSPPRAPTSFVSATGAAAR